MIWLLVILAVLAAAAGLSLWTLRAAGRRAPVPELGARGGRLQPCPGTSNCTSSQARPDDVAHYLPPIPFQGDAERVADVVDAVASARPNAVRVARHEGYMRFAFRVDIVGWTDDVEFLVDPAAGVVHFRSASRVGRSDLGINRTRMRSLSDRIHGALEDEGLDAARA